MILPCRHVGLLFSFIYLLYEQFSVSMSVCLSVCLSFHLSVSSNFVVCVLLLCIC